jgi:hypothetical protein
VLSIVFWREKEMSTDVVVRPDGKISLPLLKDVQAAGYTPDQLTDALVKAASKYVGQPNATVVVKAINSRKVFIVGKVAKPGAFPLTGDMTVSTADRARWRRRGIREVEQRGRRAKGGGWRVAIQGQLQRRSPRKERSAEHSAETR